MRLIHLSDQHIGKRVNEVSMLEGQEYVLRQILQIIDTEKADAVLIAGDVYDKSIPPAEAVTLFDDFLCRLAKRDLPVFIISGNHDSPERLAFGNRLLEHSGIHISPVYSGKIEPVMLTDEYGTVNFWLLPFVKPVHVKRFYPDEGIESYTDAIRTAIQHMALDKSARNVLLTHQFVTGAATCESEEVSVGGTDNVDAEVFEDFDYVALGHLHGPQNIGSNRIRYCGTPLKYSFSECGHHKSVTVVELGAKENLELHLCPLTPRHDMRQIRGDICGADGQSKLRRYGNGGLPPHHPHRRGRCAGSGRTSEGHLSQSDEAHLRQYPHPHKSGIGQGGGCASEITAGTICGAICQTK